MRLLIKKRSGKPFPPPFTNDGKTAIAVGITTNEFDPKHSEAYILENGKFVNCGICKIVKDLENLPQEGLFSEKPTTNHQQ